MRKCDFCSESPSNPNAECGRNGCPACKEAAERFYNYMMQVAAANGRTYNKNININDKNKSR